MNITVYVVTIGKGTATVSIPAGSTVCEALNAAGHGDEKGRIEVNKVEAAMSTELNDKDFVVVAQKIKAGI